MLFACCSVGAVERSDRSRGNQRSGDRSAGASGCRINRTEDRGPVSRVSRPHQKSVSSIWLRQIRLDHSTKRSRADRPGQRRAVFASECQSTELLRRRRSLAYGGEAGGQADRRTVGARPGGPQPPTTTHPGGPTPRHPAVPRLPAPYRRSPSAPHPTRRSERTLSALFRSFRPLFSSAQTSQIVLSLPACPPARPSRPSRLRPATYGRKASYRSGPRGERPSPRPKTRAVNPIRGRRSRSSESQRPVSRSGCGSTPG